MLTSSDRRLSCSMDGTVLPDRKVNRHLQPVDLCFHDFLHLKQSCNRKRKDNARTQCIRDYASRSHKSPSRYLGVHYFVLGSYSFFLFYLKNISRSTYKGLLLGILPYLVLPYMVVGHCCIAHHRPQSVTLICCRFWFLCIYFLLIFFYLFFVNVQIM